MRFKLFLLAAVAALATAMPARATIVLEWHLSTNQAATTYATAPNTDDGPGGSNEAGDYPTIGVVGPLVTGPLNLNAGQTVILQAVLHQIDAVGPNTVNYNGPGTQGTTSGGGLIGWGVRINNSQPTLATHVQPSANNLNTRGVNIYGFNGAGATIVTQGSNPTVGTTSAFSTVRDITTQDWYNEGDFYPLFNFRFQAGNTGGSGTLTFVDPSGGADIGTQQQPNMDAAIFGGAPSLTFNVTAVPEPSSMVLAGLGLAGLGYRLRRKKVAKEEVAA
jgi:hypothetical protein